MTMLAKSKVWPNKYNPGGINCYCCNDTVSTRHGNKARRKIRKQEKQVFRRKEERYWREMELNN